MKIEKFESTFNKYMEKPKEVLAGLLTVMKFLDGPVYVSSSEPIEELEKLMDRELGKKKDSTWRAKNRDDLEFSC
jgi:hypothetical protein